MTPHAPGQPCCMICELGDTHRTRRGAGNATQPLAVRRAVSLAYMTTYSRPGVVEVLSLSHRDRIATALFATDFSRWLSGYNFVSRAGFSRASWWPRSPAEAGSQFCPRAPKPPTEVGGKQEFRLMSQPLHEKSSDVAGSAPLRRITDGSLMMACDLTAAGLRGIVCSWPTGKRRRRSAFNVTTT